MPVEQALVDAAGGDFVATLAAVLVLFIIGIFAYFIRWVMVTMPEQMQKDRQAITCQMQADRDAICLKLSEMISRVRDNEAVLEKHDEQAKKILETDQRIESHLNARPCLKMF